MLASICSWSCGQDWAPFWSASTSSQCRL